jgi:hypothetical protein
MKKAVHLKLRVRTETIRAMSDDDRLLHVVGGATGTGTITHCQCGTTNSNVHCSQWC